MKHLRQRRYMAPLQSLLEQSGISLEHPFVTSLHDSLVIQGDFAKSETLLSSMASASLFAMSLQAEQPHAHWTQLHGVDADGDAPSARGGHAMCIDPQSGKIYLFGGWDGQKNLDDFWVYDIRSESWQILSYATQREAHGPSPRSCHKMIFDTATGAIYVFGRLDEASADITDLPVSAAATHGSGVDAPVTSPVSPRQASPPIAFSGPRSTPTVRGAEFYRYQTRGRDQGTWELLSVDTSVRMLIVWLFRHAELVLNRPQGVHLSCLTIRWKSTRKLRLSMYLVEGLSTETGIH